MLIGWYYFLSKIQNALATFFALFNGQLFDSPSLLFELMTHACLKIDKFKFQNTMFYFDVIENYKIAA